MHEFLLPLAQAHLSRLDYAIILLFFVVSLAIGVAVSKQAGKSTADFFVGGRSMPWWLLGVSMVATTFSTDTPNLVTDIVRGGGVAGNWGWWAFLVGGMVTVFIFAKLWRRAGVLTDVEFYELRYSGKSAAFLRGFRAIYLGFVFNVLIMGMVTLAAVKFGEVVLGIDGLITVIACCSVVLVYSSLGGLKGVVLTDFVQFALAMVGAVWAAIWVLQQPEINGIQGLLNHPLMETDKLNLLPNFDNPSQWIPLLLVPLAIQWWAAYYPGAEPGGGGYIAQRMFSAKDERNAMGATFLFNLAHYALRPWPWIILALASFIFLPTKLSQGEHEIQVAEGAEDRVEHIGKSHLVQLETAISTQLTAASTKLAELETAQASETKTNAAEGTIADLTRLQTLVAQNQNHIEVRTLAYLIDERSTDAGKAENKYADVLTNESHVALALAAPTVELTRLGHDLGYPAMLTRLPKGLLGLIAASLLAAYMSTMSTQVNLGASYLVNDFYARFIDRKASEKTLVWVGRISTIAMLALGGFVGLKLESAKEAFDAILLLGAGTGGIYILRWFWWKINAATEIIAMVSSLAIALFFKTIAKDIEFFAAMEDWQILVLGVILTTLTWVLVTFITPNTDKKTLRSFYQKVQPGGPGWRKVIQEAKFEGEPIDQNQQGWDVPTGILCSLLGCVAIYGALFATGWWIYGKTTSALIMTITTVVATLLLTQLWKKLKFQES